MAPSGYWSAKCGTCGHPRGKHTVAGGGGCAMRYARNRRLASGKMVTTMRDCECRVFTEQEK